MPISSTLSLCLGIPVFRVIDPEGFDMLRGIFSRFGQGSQTPVTTSLSNLLSTGDLLNKARSFQWASEEAVVAAHSSVSEAEIKLDQLGLDRVVINTPSVNVILALLDDSGSMKKRRDEVLKSFNDGIQSLRDSGCSSDFLICVVSMFSGVVIPFTSLRYFPILTHSHYDPSSDFTPLRRYVSLVASLGLLATSSLKNRGIRARLCTLILSDGGEHQDCKSPDLRSVRALVENVLQNPKNVLMGASLHPEARAEYLNMGFQVESIRDANSLGLDRVFQEFSQVSSAAS